MLNSYSDIICSNCSIWIDLETLLYISLLSCHRYAISANTYFTGFFTSRPSLKRYIRMLSGYYLVSSYNFLFSGCMYWVKIESDHVFAILGLVNGHLIMSATLVLYDIKVGFSSALKLIMDQTTIIWTIPYCNQRWTLNPSFYPYQAFK